MKWLIRKWNERRRNIEILILWPRIKREARDIEIARGYFMRYALRSRAWRELRYETIREIVSRLR